MKINLLFPVLYNSKVKIPCIRVEDPHSAPYSRTVQGFKYKDCLAIFLLYNFKEKIRIFPYRWSQKEYLSKHHFELWNHMLCIYHNN